MNRIKYLIDYSYVDTYDINLLKEARKPKYLNTNLDYSALENS